MNLPRISLGREPQALEHLPSVSPELQADIAEAKDFLELVESDIQFRVKKANAGHPQISGSIRALRAEHMTFMYAIDHPVSPDLVAVRGLAMANRAAGTELQGAGLYDTAAKGLAVAIGQRIRQFHAGNTTPDAPNISILSGVTNHVFIEQPLAAGEVNFLIRDLKLDRDRQVVAVQEYKLSGDPKTAELSERTNPGNSASPQYEPLDWYGTWLVNKQLRIPDLKQY